MAIDFEYHQLSLFTAIYPVSAQGIAEYNRLNLGDGTGKLLPHEFAAFKAQAKRAGYSIRKAQAPKTTIEAILKDLDI